MAKINKLLVFAYLYGSTHFTQLFKFVKSTLLCKKQSGHNLSIISFTGKVIILSCIVWSCSKVPVNVLKNPPVNDRAPEGYVNIKSYDFENETDLPPNDELETMEVWGIDHICRKSGGMYDADGNYVLANDPRNYIEWNQEQVQWVNGFLALITDLNADPDGTPVVSGKVATITSYDPPVFVSARVRVAPEGRTFWTAGVSYSPNGWLPETDFFEFEGKTSKAYTTSVHRKVNGKHVMIGTKKYKFPVDLSENFHIYAMLMERDQLTFYLDNVVLWTFKKEHVNSEPVYFLVENAIFNDCDPDLISAEKKEKLFPKTVYVDYLRIYAPNKQ